MVAPRRLFSGIRLAFGASRKNSAVSFVLKVLVLIAVVLLLPRVAVKFTPYSACALSVQLMLPVKRQCVLVGAFFCRF